MECSTLNETSICQAQIITEKREGRFYELEKVDASDTTLFPWYNCVAEQRILQCLVLHKEDQVSQNPSMIWAGADEVSTPI